MPFVLALIAGVMIVSALRNTQGQLATALETDIPPFAKWAAAVVAVGGLGYVPGLQTLSRWLLALIFVVLVVANYTRIIGGFTGAASGIPGQRASAAAASPADAYLSNPNQPPITLADVQGGGAVAGSSAAHPFDPTAYLTAIELGTLGFGGLPV